MAEVTVAMVNWNGMEYLPACLKALMRQSYKSFDVIMVDNGSTDGSVDFIRKNYPKIRIIANRENLGVAEATNQGLAAAKTKYVASLHNDTRPDKDWLKSLVSAIKSAPENVVCIEGEVYHDPPAGVLNGSLNVLSYNIFDVFEGLEKKFYSGTCSMIIKNGILKRYCDPEYFFYQEDVYLGWTLRLMGYDVRREPRSKTWHAGTASVKNESTRRRFRFLSERNRLMNVLIFYEPKTIAEILPLFVLQASGTVIKHSIFCPWKARAHLSAYFWCIANIRKIMSKRGAIQSLRRVPDSSITPHLSSRLANGESGLAATMNRFSLLYCRIMGIKTVEN